MNEHLRVSVPYASPLPLHPSTSHAMRLAVERVADVYTLTVELWLVGVPRSMETHGATAGTVVECIDDVATQIAFVPDASSSNLLRGPVVSKLVARALRRVLLEGHGAPGDSGRIAVLREDEPGRVLVVDANAQVRDLMRVLLDVAGFRVVSVADLRAAIKACDLERFDAAIVDVDGGDDEGRRALDWFRSCRPPVAVVMVGVGAADSRGDLAGARYLRKPFTRRDLVDALRAELG